MVNISAKFDEEAHIGLVSFVFPREDPGVNPHTMVNMSDEEAHNGLVYIVFPREDPGVKSRMCTPYPQRVVKGDKMGRFLGITV